MAEYEFNEREFYPDIYTCPVCSELLKDPVTVPCGHHLCSSCVSRHWDKQEEHQRFSCPQCKRRFSPRPVLVRNKQIVKVMKQLQDNEEGKCFAGPGDVSCDLCYWRKKQKAVQSCLTCLLSYCESHFAVHRDLDPLKNHTVVAPRGDLHENRGCLLHLQPLTKFCSTDSHLICKHCASTKHKDHDLTTAKKEMRNRKLYLLYQMGLLERRLQFHQEELESMFPLLLMTEILLIVERDGCDHFDDVSALLIKRQIHVENQIKAQQFVTQSQVQKLQGSLEQELSELKRQQAELKEPEQILLKYKDLSELKEQPQSSTEVFPDFTDITEALSDLTDKLQPCTNMEVALTQNKLLLQQPTTREQYLQYSVNISLNPNTAHRRLLLSEENHRVSVVKKEQNYPPHPDRFTHRWQALSSEMLSGQSYFEVECGDKLGFLGFTYKRIQRKKDVKDSALGYNNVSWVLKTGMTNHIIHNGEEMQVRNTRQCEKIGVFVDHPAGCVSFYGISPKEMFLCGQLYAEFTEPLYVAVGFTFSETYAHFVKLK